MSSTRRAELFSFSLGGSVRFFLGFFLLVAASLKVHGLVTETIQPVPILSSMRVQLGALEVEALLGLWLLVGLRQQAARWVSLLFFAALAATSLYLGLLGESSCGCFGRIRMSPWLTFGLDLTAVLLLAMWRVPSDSTSTTVRWNRRALLTFATTVVTLVLIGGAGAFFFDDPWSAFSRLRGETISVEPADSEIGTGVSGELHEFSVRLVNHSNHSVRCYGGTANCRCLAIKDLPMVLPPGESRPIRLQITFRGGPGLFRERFVIFTDDEVQSLVVARATGRLTDSTIR